MEMAMEKKIYLARPWIPSSPLRKVLSSRRGAVYTKVCELINPMTNQWDEDLLRSIFVDVDVRRIMQIPLHSHGFDDFIAWGATSHGRYTVRSGYYIFAMAASVWSFGNTTSFTWILGHKSGFGS